MSSFIKYQPKNNIAYLLNPKVACSTLQNSLLQGKVANVHDVNNFPPYNNNAVPIFSVVRNPFSRAVSAYLDKVVSRKDDVVWRNFVQSLGLEVNYDISFEEYLDILALHPKLRESDKHFRPQIHNFHGIKPSFIGYMEDMDTVSQFLTKHGVEIKNRVPHKTNSEQKKKDLLSSPSVVKKIQKLYSKDFSTFGYSKDVDADFDLKPIIQEQSVPSRLLHRHVNILSDDLADVFREAALLCEGDNKRVALRLIKLAKSIRPNGPVINEVYERLKDSK